VFSDSTNIGTRPKRCGAETSLMEHLKPLFPLHSHFNQGRNQYPWQPPGEVTGYAPLLSPRTPLLLLKKPRRRVERENEVRRRGWPSDILEMEGYPSIPLRVQYRNLVYPSVLSPITHFLRLPLLSTSFAHRVFNLFPLLSPSFIPMWFSFHWDASPYAVYRPLCFLRLQEPD
jgi:hypothetical protein